MSLAFRETLERKSRERRTAEIKIEDETAYLVSMSERQRAYCEKITRKNPEHLNAALIVQTLCDEDGNRLFSDEELDVVLELDSRYTAILAEAAADHCSGADLEAVIKN